MQIIRTERESSNDCLEIGGQRLLSIEELIDTLKTLKEEGFTHISDFADDDSDSDKAAKYSSWVTFNAHILR